MACKFCAQFEGTFLFGDSIYVLVRTEDQKHELLDKCKAETENIPNTNIHIWARYLNDPKNVPDWRVYMKSRGYKEVELNYNGCIDLIVEAMK